MTRHGRVGRPGLACAVRQVPGPLWVTTMTEPARDVAMSGPADARTIGPALTAARLRRLRCRGDRLGLIVLGLVLVCGLATAGATALLWPLVGVVGLRLVAGALHTATLLGNAVPLGPAVAPTWDRALCQIQERAGGRRAGIAVVVTRQPRANAYALRGLGRPVIVVTSGLVSLIDEEAGARFVLGHELGHVLFHLVWLGPLQALAALPRPWGGVARLLLLGWLRSAERGADRLGLVLAGSPIAAASALVALSAGLPLRDADLPATLRTLPCRPVGPWGYVAEALADHPFLRPRLRDLFAYAASPEFARVVGAEAAKVARQELSMLGVGVDPGGRWPT